MRKFFLMALMTALVVANSNAEDIFYGPHAVSWGTPLNLAPENFANAEPGDKIVVTYTDAKEMVNGKNEGSVIEFKVMNEHFDHLAGSRDALRIRDNGSTEQFLTAPAVDSLKAHGLQIIGNDFTVTKVELLFGKYLRNEGTLVWTGFFWADSWSTLEIYKESYSFIDFSKYQAIRFYTEAGRSDFVINVIINAWPNQGGENVANQNAMTAGEGYMELPLTDELRTKLAEASKWMILFNKETGKAFNVTDIVLVEDATQALEKINTSPELVRKVLRNGQILIEHDGQYYNLLGMTL
jgi:hypothetical protein